MSILLDTCSFLWLAADPARLSEVARAELQRTADIALSHVSVLEICLKWSAGKLTLPAPPRVWVEEQAASWSLTRLPLTPGHCYRASELARLHADPFDRLLVAQALDTGRALVTPDAWIQRYPVGVIW